MEKTGSVGQRLVAGLSPERASVVEAILRAALRSADPRAAVHSALQLDGSSLTIAGETFDLDRYARLRVVAVGKAAPAMTQGLLDVLGDRLDDGLILTKHAGEPGLPARLQVLTGGHPVPNEDSVTGARALESFLQGGRPDDLVFCLISGGGSALMTLPVEGVSLADMQALTRLLLASGANIGEMNTLRKHLDRVKGGGLARMTSPARLVALILSDVIGSPLDVIASGPTVADTSTYADALQILRKYRIEEQVPDSIRAVLLRGLRGEMAETVKPGDPALAGVKNLIVASNPQAARGALAEAERAGFHTLLLTTYLQGEASQAGVVMAGILRQIADTMHGNGQPLPRPACIVAGGETTVTLRGKGKGGRSQELALGAAFLLDGLPDVALLALGTDGEDGPTDAAGALATGETITRAQAMGLDPLAYLQENNAYPFFEALGDLIRTGPTGTNVNDLVFLFAF